MWIRRIHEIKSCVPKGLGWCSSCDTVSALWAGVLLFTLMVLLFGLSLLCNAQFFKSHLSCPLQSFELTLGSRDNQDNLKSPYGVIPVGFVQCVTPGHWKTKFVALLESLNKHPPLPHFPSLPNTLIWDSPLNDIPSNPEKFRANIFHCNPPNIGAKITVLRRAFKRYVI